MPIFEELAEHYEDDANVIIAKMDSTKNEVKEFSVSGFPTLKFFPSGSSEVMDYEGGRELDALVDYIHENRGDKGVEKKETVKKEKAEVDDDDEDEDEDDDEDEEDDEKDEL